MTCARCGTESHDGATYCGRRRGTMPRSLPTGVTIHDARTDTLRHDSEWTVLLEDGERATLRLRLARAVLS